MTCPFCGSEISSGLFRLHCDQNSLHVGSTITQKWADMTDFMQPKEKYGMIDPYPPVTMPCDTCGTFQSGVVFDGEEIICNHCLTEKEYEQDICADPVVDERPGECDDGPSGGL